MTENIEELQHLHTSWVEHKYTKILLSAMVVQIKDAWNVLQSACANTTDPKVMYAFSKWRTLHESIEDIKKGPTSDQ